MNYSFVQLKGRWPGRERPQGWRPGKSPFKGKAWGRIEQDLDRELRHLRAKEITIALEVDFRDIREDGGIRSDARPKSPKVLLTFVDGRDGVRRQFPCEQFAVWQDNVWAIVLTLEALRSIDRWGVTQGDQQYVGFAALPRSASEPEPMTLDQAASVLELHSGMEADAIMQFGAVARVAVRAARAKTHPDSGKEPDAIAFNQVQEAARVLSEALALQVEL